MSSRPQSTSPPLQRPAYAVEAVGLNKTYAPLAGSSPRPALRDVDLAIPRGALFGLLGPNGAGKSTFINILAGLTRKSSGMVKVWGIDIDRDHRRARAAIGVVPQELNIDPFFTPFELLEIHAGLYGVSAARRRTSEILEAVGLL
ncbi:MAG: ABC transporter ATP-binding protein, partial [Alphaproteobacteria bacterium]|nr:ABC transporter ATP-binding protein [Alphaproteobacteria bacterium]